MGNVVVEKDDSSLLAQKMIVTYEEKESSAKSDQKIKRIEADNNVKIFSEEFIGSGDIGYYEPQNDMFVLEKNVVINNGTSIASGDKFVYNLKTKKGNFVGKKDETSINGNGGDKRVIVVIGDDLKESRKTLGKKKDKE